jgi:hypothetical protein
MADRSSLRGTRLGGTSFEDESGIEFAPRQQVSYHCPNGHEFDVPMSDEAEVPFTWECPRCGHQARRVGGTEPAAKEEKPIRTHWDMLRERRSIPELEDILSERLELLRNGAIGPEHLHRRSGRGRAKKSA